MPANSSRDGRSRSRSTTGGSRSANRRPRDATGHADGERRGLVRGHGHLRGADRRLVVQRAAPGGQSASPSAAGGPSASVATKTPRRGAGYRLKLDSVAAPAVPGSGAGCPVGPTLPMRPTNDAMQPGCSTPPNAAGISPRAATDRVGTELAGGVSCSEQTTYSNATRDGQRNPSLPAAQAS